MTKTCGNCGKCTIPGPRELEKAGITTPKLGFCIYAGEFVLLDDKAEDFGCEEESWEPR